MAALTLELRPQALPWAYEVPPFHVGEVRTTVRVMLRHPSGVHGCGEAAGWPGRSVTPTPEQFVAALRPLESLPLHPEALKVAAQRLCQEPPAVGWSLYVAFAKMVAAACGVPLQLLPERRQTDEVAAVQSAGLMLHATQPPPLARHLKIKVTERVTAPIQQALLALRPRFQHQALRIDGNHALRADEVQALRDPLGTSLDFFEEPIPVAELGSLTPHVPLALDESLAALGWPELMRLCDVAAPVALVLKPSALGPARLFALIAHAAERQLRTVVSSLFESAAGLCDLAHLQAELAPQEVAGLGTARFFAKTDPSYVDTNGALWLPTAAVEPVAQ